MKKEKIEYQIYEALSERTPDILASIKNSREFRVPVKPKKAFFGNFSFKSFSYSLATVFTLVLLVALVFSSQQGTPVVASTITVDINPSVQITLDEDDLVINVTAINADGEEIINNNVKFQGLTLDETIEIIIEAAYIHGYIVETTDENIILISVDSDDLEVRDRLEFELESKIASEVNRYAPVVRVIKERRTNLTDDETDQLIDVAKDNEVSLGKLLLIRKIIALDSSYSLDELKDSPVRELYRIYNDLTNPADGDDGNSNNCPNNPDFPNKFPGDSSNYQPLYYF